jgi:hypothetical protein
MYTHIHIHTERLRRADELRALQEHEEAERMARIREEEELMARQQAEQERRDESVYAGQAEHEAYGHDGGVGGDRNSGYGVGGDRNSGYGVGGDRNSGYGVGGDCNSGYMHENQGEVNGGFNQEGEYPPIEQDEFLARDQMA